MTYELQHLAYPFAKGQAHLRQLKLLDLPADADERRQPVAFGTRLDAETADHAEMGPLWEPVRVYTEEGVEERPPDVEPFTFETPAAEEPAQQPPASFEQQLDRAIFPVQDSTGPGASPEADPGLRVERTRRGRVVRVPARLRDYVCEAE